VAVSRALMADYLKQWGNVLFCKSCHHIQPVAKYQFSKYLKSGWPKCCGQTMALVQRIDDPILMNLMK
jgi:hypothetical protein